MFRSVTLTVPAGTTMESPVSVTVKMAKGTLNLVRIKAPPGPNWEVFAKVRYREFSLVPTQEDEWIPLEDEVEEMDPNFNGWDGTYDVDCELCSPGAIFSHDVTFELNVLESETTEQLFKHFIESGF